MDVRTLCLGILALGDASGYEIKKMVAEGSFSFFSEASYGSIYPALTKLTEDGLVECREQAQDKRPDKKVYSLTPAGRAALMAQLDKGPGPDKNRSEFLAALLFAEEVAPGRVQAMVGERIRQHEAKIADLEALLLEEDLTPASRFVIEYGLATQRAALKYLNEKKNELLRSLPHPTAAAE
mgnify:CR=1 FL=1